MIKSINSLILVATMLSAPIMFSMKKSNTPKDDHQAPLKAVLDQQKIKTTQPKKEQPSPDKTSQLNEHRSAILLHALMLQ